MPTLLAPRYWGGHLLMVVCVAIAIALGVWQYGAWGHRRDDAARDLANVPAKPLSSVMGGDSAFPGKSLGQPVKFAGSWLPEGTMYVADEFSHRKRGYWVVTPVLIDKSAMLVVRGWARTPHAAAPSGSADVTGWLQAADGDDTVADSNPHDDVIPNFQIADIVNHVSADLYSGYVIAKTVAPEHRGTAEETAATTGLDKVTPDSIPKPPSFTAFRNLLYAIQWWVFAGFAVFIWWKWGQDAVSAEPGEATPDEPEAA